MPSLAELRKQILKEKENLKQVQDKKILPEVKIIPKKKLPKIREDIDFSNMTITQDDLWFLFRLKTGEGTRVKRSILLPKFSEVFNRNLNESKK